MPRGFQTVEEREIPSIPTETRAPPAAQQPVANPAVGVMTQLLLLTMKTIGQKTLVAISTLFTAAGLFSAWWLWNSILPAPSVLQLVGLGMYAVFLLTLELVRRR